MVVIAAIVLLCAISSPLNAQEQTVGLFVYDKSASFDGYTLFTGFQYNTVYLIDNYGRIVNTWTPQYVASNSVYLLENGDIIVPGSASGFGTVEELDWDGNQVWFYQYPDSAYQQHHDIEYLPNGNVLMLMHETISYEDAIAAGRDPALLTGGIIVPDLIVEIEPTGPTSGNIVWKWRFWDHLIQDFDETKDNFGVVGNHPELLDLNFVRNGGKDWIHANAVEYNAALDQIIVSSNFLSEIYIIDHSTTMAEAAGHSGGQQGKGGDFLFRWGNPQAYRAGTAADQQHYGQHDPLWIPDGYPGAGHITLFNNGNDRPGDKYSIVEELELPLDITGGYQTPQPGEAFDPPAPTWTYIADPPTDLYSRVISGAQRLPNGNTIICSGVQGRLFEVTPDGSIVWEYINPIVISGPLKQGANFISRSNMIFRCRRYAPDYAGLAGIELVPGRQVELYPIHITATTYAPEEPQWSEPVTINSAVIADSGIASVKAFIDNGDGFVAYDMYDDGLHDDGAADDGIYGTTSAPLNSDTVASYYIAVEDSDGVIVNDPPSAPDIAYQFTVSGPGYMCGDATGDEIVNVGDAVYIVNYIFKGGAAPNPVDAGDANGDGVVNVGDAVYIINYIFKGGAEPICP